MNSELFKRPGIIGHNPSPEFAFVALRAEGKVKHPVDQ